MRNGLKWWQLVLFAVTGGIALLIQNKVGTSIEHYTVLVSAPCAERSWDGNAFSDNHGLEGTFSCGGRTVVVDNGVLLAQYQRSHSLVCTFERGDLLKDEREDCKA